MKSDIRLSGILLVHVKLQTQINLKITNHMETQTLLGFCRGNVGQTGQLDTHLDLVSHLGEQRPRLVLMFARSNPR